MSAWPFAAGAVLLGSVGQLFLKLGSGAGLPESLADWRTAVGVVLYGISFLCWLKVLAAWPLARAYPVLSLNFALVALLAAAVLKEPLTVRGAVGAALCVLGVAVLGRG